jgi:hypothetical protein
MTDAAPDATAELLTLLHAEIVAQRGEIAALREQLAVTTILPLWVRNTWLPELRKGQLIMPVRQIQLMKWIRHRSAVTALPPATVNKQRHRSLVLLVFAIVRVACWLVVAAVVSAGLAGADAFAWAKHLAESLPFVVLISVYANAATDLDSGTSAFAALVASDVHAQVALAGSMLAADLAEVQEDIDKIAELQGDEAADLASVVKTRLAGEARKGPGKGSGKAPA